MSALLEKGTWKAGPYSPADYYADHSCTSHSMLEKFRQSQRLYQGVYVTHEIVPDEPTAAMKLGTAVHAALLEPERFPSTVIPGPDCDRRSNAGKALWAEAEMRAATTGGFVLKAEDYVKVAMMAAQARRLPMLAELLSVPGAIEQPVRWTCPDSGVPRKAKLDKWFPAGLILDLKTAADPSPEAFARACVNLGYHRQAAYYVDAAEQCYGLEEPARVIFVVLGSEAPFDAWCYELDEESMNLGDMQNHRDLAALNVCRETGRYGIEQTAPLTLSLPRWAFSQG